jgi:hypothetical protein
MRVSKPREQSDPIALIQARLRKYPQARYDASIGGVVVFPIDASGFTVRFRDLGDHFRVECDGWRGEFAAADAAIECFVAALGAGARLHVRRRGRWPYRWQLQFARDGRWESLPEAGRLFFPFWRSSNLVYLQNRFLEAA